MRVGDAVAEHARLHPDKSAVVEPDGKSVSYRELIRLADEEAVRLRGYSSGVPVPVAASSGLEYLKRFIGVMRAGRVALCLQEGTSQRRARELVSSIPPVSGEGYGNELFYMGLTSGSAGVPKAVLRTHESWLRSFELMSQLFGVPERAAVTGSLSFSAALIYALHVLHEGGTLWLMPQGTETSLPALMQRERITSAFMVPARLRALVERSRGRVPSLESTIVTAGARLDPDTRASIAGLLPGVQIFEYYGSAEMGFVTYIDHEAALERPASVGRLCPGVACELRGEDGLPVQQGEGGLLHTSSPYQFSGYAGEEPVPPGGWVTAGDWGYFDTEGYLYLLGRSEERINVGGLKVFAAEVERALTSHPGVEEAAVIALPDRMRGQVTGAAVVAASGAELSALSLRQWCARTLPRPVVPRQVVTVSALPRNTGGKLQRDALAEMFPERWSEG